LNKTAASVKDLDFLLVSPTGDTLLLLSDAGEGTTGPDPQNPSSVTLTFDDAAPGSVLLPGQLLSGTYKPTNYDFASTLCSSGIYTEPDPDNFGLNATFSAEPAAPPPPYGQSLSIFNGDDPNGTWRLYALSDCVGSSTATLGGWSITIRTGPTAARMTSFSAATAKRGVAVRWRTASEVDVLGFNVYRKTASGPLRKVNRSLIAARGGAAGASYRFVDRSARAGASYTYRLQLVDVDGTHAWYGSTRVHVKQQ